MATESVALPRTPPMVLVPSSTGCTDGSTTVDHKRLGILYILYALVFLLIGGIEATIMRIQLIVPHNHLVSPQVFNRHVHHAWHHDDFLRGHAARVRVRQLPGAADDRRARHGVPASECVQLLDDGIRRPSSLLQLGRRQRPVRRGQRARRGMVRLCSADFADILARTQHRFLDAGASGLRLRQHRHGDQHCDHDPVPALSGHDAREDAAVRLAESRDGVPGACWPSAR